MTMSRLATRAGPLDVGFETSTGSGSDAQQRAAVASVPGMGRHLVVPTALDSAVAHLKLTFSRPVQSVSLAVLKLPPFQEHGAQVLVTSSGLTFERSAHFVGEGSPSSPFSNAGPRAGNLRLTWRGPLTAIDVQLLQVHRAGTILAPMRVSDVLVRV
ncbi:MAG: hypothetical protein ACTIA6_05635 [Pseudoclavibacter sp.]